MKKREERERVENFIKLRMADRRRMAKGPRAQGGGANGEALYDGIERYYIAALQYSHTSSAVQLLRYSS